MTVALLAITAAGATALRLSVAGARHPTIHPLEVRVFRAVNGLPAVWYPLLWVPMQLGNLVVGGAAGMLVAWCARDLRLAVGVVLAIVLKLIAERLIRARTAAYLSVRQRPATSQPGAILRGRDVPRQGPSFPSGHVILAAAIACLVARDLGGWQWAPWVATLLVMMGRVYVGAHNPLDVTAGLGAGSMVGGALALLLT